MLQTNCVFDFLNRSSFVISSKNSIVRYITGKNINFIIPTTNKNYDKFNIQITSFRKSLKISKNLTVDFFYNFFMIKWFRINFRGKSYRIKNFKSINKFTFYFGYSHWTKLKLLKMWRFFRRSRQKYVLITYLSRTKLLFSMFFKNIRLMNRYTLRGLRLRKQAIKRRFGKISQHISILH